MDIFIGRVYSMILFPHQLVLYHIWAQTCLSNHRLFLSGGNTNTYLPMPPAHFKKDFLMSRLSMPLSLFNE